MSVASLSVVLSSVLGFAPAVPLQRPSATRTNETVVAPDAATPPDAGSASADATPPSDTPPSTVESDVDAPTTEPIATGEPIATDEPSTTNDPRTTDDPRTTGEPIAIDGPAPSFDLEPTRREPIVIDLDERDRKLRRAHSLVAGGSVLAVAGLVMLIGAGTEAAKPACKFDLDTCANAPRPKVARGLGIGAGVALASGAALIGVGLHRRRKLHASLTGDAHAVALTVRGRF